jgi:hypothetical protein
MKNPFKEFEAKQQGEPKEIQKAEIFSALRNSNNPVHIKKTGKEIKNHISNNILPKLIEKKDALASQIADFLSNASVLPQQKPWMKIMFMEEEFPYKQYTWEEQNWCEKAFGGIFKGFGEVECCDEGECVEEAPISPYYPQTKEEAAARAQYNNWVEDYRDLIYDIKTANVLITNLKDEDEYWLTVDQLTALNFDEN